MVMPHGDFRKLSSISIRTRKKWDEMSKRVSCIRNDNSAQLEPSDSCYANEKISQNTFDKKN